MAPGGAKMTADVETAPVIGLRRNGRRLERPHRRPFIRLGVLRKRQRDQHAAANEPTPNEPMPHQAPRYPVCLFAPTQAAPSRSPASRRGTQAERKNYAELVTIIQNSTGRRGAPGGREYPGTASRKNLVPGGAFFLRLLVPIRADKRCQ